MKAQIKYNFAKRVTESKAVAFEITKWNSSDSFTVREMIYRVYSGNAVYEYNTMGYEQVVSKVGENWVDKYGNNFVLTNKL